MPYSRTILHHPDIALICWVLLTRLGLAWLGVSPDPEYILRHWQHADLSLLASSPIETLWYFHAQPPLWNGVLALASAWAEADATAVSAVLHVAFIGLTIASLLLFRRALLHLEFPPWIALAGAAGVGVSPSIFYYETYIFYPHLTFFYVTLLLWAAVRLHRFGRVRDLGWIMGALCLFAWTWAVAHPVLLLLVGAACLPLLRQGAATSAAAVIVIATGIATLPSIKNAHVFGMPSASSWIGLNVTQTMRWLTKEEREACSFQQAFENARLLGERPGPAVLRTPEKTSGYPNANHLAVMELSQHCLSLAPGRLLNNVPQYAWLRLEQLARSFSAPAHLYFFDPLNWDNLGPLEGLYDNNAMRFLTLCYYLALWILLLRSAHVGEHARLFRVLVLFLVTFTLVTHALNGGEQQRMRYSVEPIYFLTLVLLLRKLGERLSVRRAAPH